MPASAATARTGARCARSPPTTFTEPTRRQRIWDCSGHYRGLGPESTPGTGNVSTERRHRHRCRRREPGGRTLAGTDPGDTFYLATVRCRRDLSALILLDISGSAAELGWGRIRVHEHQRAVVAALATTMHRLGDRWPCTPTRRRAGGTSGFTPARPRRTQRPADAGPTRRARPERLLPARRGDPARRRHHRRSRRNHRRLLVVVSDGLAFDRYDLGYGAQDVRRALAEVRSQGTGCLCLTVGATTGSGDLREKAGTAAHAAVPRPGSAGTRHHPAVSFGTEIRRVPERIIISMTSERPYYQPVGNEERVFKAAYAQQLPVLLKGPTGCGKTRFAEAMAHDLGRPLITVACHDDLTTADLVGRYLLRGGDTEWVDGPLTRRAYRCDLRISTRWWRRVRTPPWCCTRSPTTVGNCPSRGSVKHSPPHPVSASSCRTTPATRVSSRT